MKLDAEQTLLLEAASPVYSLIRKDREAAAPSGQALFLYIENHLFDVEADIDAWLRDYDIDGELMRDLFSRQVGIEPRTYLWDCRLLTASRLLSDSPLSVTAIGEIVGFSSRQAFSDAFESWSNERPSDYRSSAHTRVAKFGRPPEWMLSESFLQRLELGKLTPVEVQAVEERLRFLSRMMSSETDLEGSAETAYTDKDDRFEGWIALRLWEKIKGLSYREQKLFVANQVVLRTASLSELLLDKSTKAEGVARQQLEHLAELALDAYEKSVDR